MGNHCSKQQFKRVKYTDASSPTLSKQQRHGKLVELQSGECKSESLLLPSSESLEKIDVPSASGANSDPSASSTSVIGNNYHVFLSFRGPDTRNGFVDHLYHRLNDVGLRFHENFVFRDDKDLPFGKDIAANLISAFKHSKVSIPIISENYAASEWCLREIIQIMKCVERGEQKVLPVLYKVKPKHVRELKGAFGKAFKSSMHLFEEDVKQQGLEALRKVVGSRVFESEKFADGREAELIKELVRVIMDERQHDFLPPLPGNLVGIDDSLAEVMKLVDTNPSETRIIGICGIGGIGKTTLATNIYNKLSKEFEWRSFLMDIRETINCKGMEHIQSLLISDITKNHGSRVRDSVTGIGMIRLSCEKKKVLILLDDVGHQNHLDKLIGGCNFKPGSIIIITCRDKALLMSEYISYELKEMNSKDSMLLFSLYAFEAKQPPTDFTILSRDIVATTGGIPLALEIIGSFLKRKDKSIWIETLENLRKVPHTKVQEKLKISYDALEHNEKQMFLDIACFFIGYDKRIATYLWKDLQLHPHSGLARMIELSLIKYDDNKFRMYDHKFRMHDQLRDLGRAITRSKSVQPWLCSRLWGEEAIKVLRRKEENENIEALRLDERGSREFMELESFKKMPNLKFLHVKDVNFDGDFERSLAELRWLKWERCRGFFEMTNFHLEKLVILDLSGDYSSGKSISENWRGWSSIKMERLKVLNLSWCSRLKSTPNLSMCKNLEMLILESCTYLEEIDPSIGDVKCLVSLNLRYCMRLKKLPEQLGELKNLEELVVDHTKIKEIPPCIGSLKKLKTLSVVFVLRLPEVLSLSLAECNKLQPIPSSIGKLGELVKLDLSNSGIKELPQSIGELTKLKILRIKGSKIKRLPSSIGKLQSLQELDASCCLDLGGQIHVDKGGLSSLKTLDLNNTEISGLPENLDRLSSLEHLDLLFCKLESLPKPPFSLSSLELTCQSNELPSLSHLKHLQELTLRSCMSLRSIPELPSCIRTLYVGECPQLERLPNLSNLEFLLKLVLVPEEFDLNDFDEISDNVHAIRDYEELESLEEVDSRHKHNRVLNLLKSEHLEVLIVDYCETLVEIRCPSKFLERLSLCYCFELRSLPKLPFSLSCLRLTCQSTELPSLSHLKHLKELTLYFCESLQSIPELPSCIRTLDVWGCPELERLPNLSDLEFLSMLKLARCSHLKKSNRVNYIEHSRAMNLSINPDWFDLNNFDEKADNLHAIRGLEKLGSLATVDISGRKHIQVLDLSKSEHLKWLYVKNCKSLVEIRCPSKLLEDFDRDGCESLKKFPDFLPHDRPRFMREETTRS